MVGERLVIASPPLTTGDPMELRLRTQREIKPIIGIVTSRTTSCGDSTSFYPTGTVGASSAGTDLTMLDYVIPRFHARQKAGEVFFNPMSRDRVTVSASSSPWTQKSNTMSCSTPGNIRYGEQKVDGGVPLRLVPNQIGLGLWYPAEDTAVSAADIARASTLVSTEVLAKRGRQDSEIWESLAEYKQTLQLLENPLTKLRSLSSRVLNSAERNSTSRGLLKEVSGGYLIMRYGIKPLLNDIANILDSLKKVTGKQRKTSRASESLYATKGSSGSLTFLSLDSTWTRETVDSVVLRGMSLDEVELDIFGNLGFSFKGLLTLPWELTGYSFVADWFANIGDYINASAPSLGYNQLGSCLTMSRVTSQAYRFAATANPGSGVTLIAPCQGAVGIVRETKLRGPLSRPGVALKTDFGFSQFTRSADAFSLLAQRFTKINKLVGGAQPRAFREKRSYQRWLDQPDVV